MPMRPRTPKLAELLFEQFCNAAGAVANRVADDQNGWDLIVEFPQPQTDRPADTTRPAATCLVQIKSSVRPSASYRLKLSNALRFARHALPCFVVKVDFKADGKSPDRWYLQHFWHDQIKTSLKAVREEHAKGNDGLNRHILSFKLNEAEKMEQDALFQKMLETIATIPDYAIAKSTYAEKVGYENGAGTGKFSLRGDAALQTLIDAMTGFTDGVEVENFTFTPARFGIPERKPLEGRTNAKLKVTSKPVATSDITLFCPDRSEQVQLPAEIYSPGMPGLPKELRRMRIHTSIFDMAVSPFSNDDKADGDVKISFDFDSAYALPHLCDTATVFGWLQKGAVEFEMWFDGRRTLEGHLTATIPTGAPSWSALAFVLKRLRDFVPAPQQPKGLLFRVSDFAEMKQLLKAAQMLGAEDATLRMTMAGPISHPGEVNRYIMPVYFDVGPATYFGVCQYKIKEFDIENNRLKIVLAEGTLLSRAVLRGSVTENIDFINAEIEAAEQRYSIGSSGVLFHRPDLSSIGHADSP
jgi:hypothetical protein